jgi:hypothetical protein
MYLKFELHPNDIGFPFIHLIDLDLFQAKRLVSFDQQINLQKSKTGALHISKLIRN